MIYNGEQENFDDNDYGPEYCTDNVDNRHCDCWFDGNPCCDCGDNDDEEDHNDEEAPLVGH